MLIKKIKKYSYPFQKYILIFILLFLFSGLSAFKPERKHFINSKIWETYKTWIKNNDLPKEAPAKLSREQIEIFYPQKNIAAVFKMRDLKIYYLEEKILGIEEEFDTELVSFLQNIYFRLNCGNYKFIVDLLNFSNLKVEYGSLQGSKAVKKIMNTKESERITIERIFTKDEKNIWITNWGEIEFIIPDYEIQDGYFVKELPYGKNSKIKEKEDKKEILRKEEKVSKKSRQKNLPNIGQIKELSGIYKYILTNYQKEIRKKILNNQVMEPIEFLNREYPNHTLNKEDGILLKIPEFKGLSGNMRLSFFQSKNSVTFYPKLNYEIKGKKIILNKKEIIDCSSLNKDEIEKIAPFFAHLNYMHRSIGGELFQFLLKPLGINTLIINHGEERSLLEIGYYSKFLLMMNDFWKKDDVYFSVKKVSKVDGHLEIKAHLIAKKKDSYDFCIVRFHLNKKYRIDQAMVSIAGEVRD